MASGRDVLLAAAVFVFALVPHSEFLLLILCSLCYFYCLCTFLQIFPATALISHLIIRLHILMSMKLHESHNTTLL